MWLRGLTLGGVRLGAALRARALSDAGAAGCVTFVNRRALTDPGLASIGARAFTGESVGAMTAAAARSAGGGSA